ncbi:MAG: hypothetical protein ACI85I_002601 [Arenicella sp.]|jgi:hypothetical protein
MTKEMFNCITNLYEIFSVYKLNPTMEASSMYSEEKVSEWNREITQKPLRELSGDELGFFAFKVGYTWGCKSDYKHFLPRFLDLIAQYKEGAIEAWIVFKKFHYFDWEL